MSVDSAANPAWVLLTETCSTNPLDIAPEMSLADRITLVQRLGYPRTECEARGTQDRAASVLRQLAGLIEQTHDPALIERANTAIRHWNTECIRFFENREPHASEFMPQGPAIAPNAKKTASKGRRRKSISD